MGMNRGGSQARGESRKFWATVSLTVWKLPTMLLHNLADLYTVLIYLSCVHRQTFRPGMRKENVELKEQP